VRDISRTVKRSNPGPRIIKSEARAVSAEDEARDFVLWLEEQEQDTREAIKDATEALEDAHEAAKDQE
jgi:hypothetical protein